MWAILIGCMVLFDTFGNWVAKKYSLGGHPALFASALILFVITNSFWLLALRSGSGLARGILYFALGTTLLGVLMGVLLFREQLTVTQGIGMVLGFVALILLIR